MNEPDMLSNLSENKEEMLRIEIARLPKTGMFFGICNNLRGLFVQGRTIDEMRNRMPNAIANSLQRMGYKNFHIIPIMEETNDDTSTEMIVLRYRMHLDRNIVMH